MCMGIFFCKICKNEFDGLNSLRSHSIQKHKISGEQIYIDYVLNGVTPTCMCGCGQKTSFISVLKGFRPYIKTHHNRVKGKNNFHKNPETHQRAIETQKKNWKEGKYVGWWVNKTPETLEKIEGIKEKLKNNKERGRKISQKLKGVSKTEESKLKLSNSQKERYKKNPSLRNQQSEFRLKWMKENSKVKTSKLETKFKKLLNTLGMTEGVDYIHNHLVSSIKTFFDFYIPSKKIIIETDGDFYHCNPNTIHVQPKYEIQLKNKSNDKRKNTWCQNHNIILLRYWEKDINERPEWVLSDLKDKLS